MKLSTLVIFFAISLLITLPQSERLSALAATTDTTSVPQKVTTTKEPEPTSKTPTNTQTTQTRQETETRTQQTSDTQTQQEPTASPSQKTDEPTKSDAPTSSTTDAGVTTPPPITVTSTSTVPRFTGTGSPVPGNPNSPGNNSGTSQPQIEVPASTTKTIVIAAGVVGAIVVLGGISIVLYRYQKSRVSEMDEEGEVVLRDGYSGYSGNPFQSTLDQYHRHR